VTLSYGKSSPYDLLAKARRDLRELATAEAHEDDAAMSDSLFDLAVALTSLKDWLKKHPSPSLTDSVVETFWAASVALSSFRDIANAGKHATITRYVPKTSDVLSSAPTTSLTFLEGLANAVGLRKKYPRLKIIGSDGGRHRAVELGETAIRECEAFMTLHAVT
jgi:hypothetical protein